MNTFHGPPDDNKMVVDHINADKSDNRLENLRYISHKENSQHAQNMGLNKGSSLPIVQICLKTGNILNKFSNSTKAAKEIGILNGSNIRLAIKNEKKTSNGFGWFYEEDIPTELHNVFESDSDIFENIKSIIKKNNIYSLYEIEITSSTGRPVAQICLKTGDIIKVFSNVEIATKTVGLLETCSIYNASKKGTPSKNFGWIYIDPLTEKITNILNCPDESEAIKNLKSIILKSKTDKPVAQICLKTNKIIKIFPSVKDAAAHFGLISKYNIINVIKKERKSSKGFGWMYASEVSVI